MPVDWFFKLQKRSLSDLQAATSTTEAAARFIKRHDVAPALRLHRLLQHCDILGMDYRQEPFITSVVGAVALSELRLLKYKTRIPVSKGITLYGIMDATASRWSQIAFGEIQPIAVSGRPLYTFATVFAALLSALPPLLVGDMRCKPALAVGTVLRMVAICPMYRLRAPSSIFEAARNTEPGFVETFDTEAVHTVSLSFHTLHIFAILLIKDSGCTLNWYTKQWPTTSACRSPSAQRRVRVCSWKSERELRVIRNICFSSLSMGGGP